MDERAIIDAVFLSKSVNEAKDTDMLLFRDVKSLI